MRWILSVLVISSFASTLHAAAWQHRWPVAAHTQLLLTAVGADVSIQEGSSAFISAELESSGWSIRSPAIKVKEHQLGNCVEMALQVGGYIGVRFFRLRIEVPRDSDLDVRGGAGTILIRGLHGDIQVRTTSGKTAFDDVDGTLRVVTDAGSIHVAGRFDDLQLSTHSGDIHANVSSHSQLNAIWRAQSATGPVLLQLPQSIAEKVEAHAPNGRISTSFIGPAQAASNQHQLRTKTNDAKPFIVWTDIGSISIAETP